MATSKKKKTTSAASKRVAENLKRQGMRMPHGYEVILRPKKKK